MLRTVHLHGRLGKEFGERFRLDVNTPAEAVRALAANLGGKFMQAVKLGEWHVVAGDKLGKGGDDYGFEEKLHFGLGGKDLHLLPAMAGSGKNGIFQVVLGVALIAAAFYFAPAASAGAGFLGADLGASAGLGGLITYGGIAKFGLMMALGGISSMFAATADLGDTGYEAREAADQRPSFLINGPVNTVEQGGPVPLVYGEFVTGGTVICSGIEVEQI